MTALGDLVARYRSELRRLIARRRRLDAEIAARRAVLADVLAAVGGSPDDPARPVPPRRGPVTQAEAVRRVLRAADTPLTATEIYARAIEEGAGGAERSLRNVLARKVKDGEIVADRSIFPQRYRRRDD